MPSENSIPRRPFGAPRILKPLLLLVEDSDPPGNVLQSGNDGPNGGSPDQESQKVWHRGDIRRPKSKDDRAELKSRGQFAGKGRPDFERVGGPKENHEPQANNDVPADHDYG